MIVKSAPILGLSYNYSRNQQTTLRVDRQYEMVSIDTKNEILRTLNDMKSNSTTLESGDRVYFHSSSGVPRYKFNNYCEGKDITRTIKIDKATKIVANPEDLKAEINATLHGRNGYYILPSNFFSTVQGITSPGAIEENENYFLSDSVYSHIKNKMPYFPDLKANNTPYREFAITYRSSIPFGKLEKDIKEIYEKKIPIISDNDLNKIISNEGLVIDENNFEEINEMLQSKDASIVLTGLEIMANSNYKESTFYISLLLNSNVSIVQSMAKSVNLKNFLSEFSKIAWNNAPPLFLTSLRKSLLDSKTLDLTKAEYIEKQMLRYINNMFVEYCGVVATGIEFKK